MSREKRARARIRGITLAAKVATVGGLAVAAIAVVEARAAAAAAAASGPRRVTAAADIAAEASADDTAPPKGDALFKVTGGNCGCSPCWGPPAPPAKRGRARRRTMRATR